VGIQEAWEWNSLCHVALAVIFETLIGRQNHAEGLLDIIVARRRRRPRSRLAHITCVHTRGRDAANGIDTSKGRNRVQKPARFAVCWSAFGLVRNRHMVSWLKMTRKRDDRRRGMWTRWRNEDKTFSCKSFIFHISSAYECERAQSS
jgi:hypothetical protein